MKKFICFAVSLALATVVFAQRQQGLVKTIGRPEKPGQGIGQVEVRIKGDINHLLSDDKGEFSFDISHLPDTRSFIISSARKKGYVIADSDLSTRRIPYSEDIPVVVVMISQEEYEADALAIEKKTRQAVQANYEQRVELLEQQYKDALINEEKYRSELSDLMDWYDNIDNLVAKMAEYYARVDYDFLSEADAKINYCIEQGQLDRADSLIDARGNIYERFSDAKSQIKQGRKMQASGAAVEMDGLAKLHSAQQDAEHKYNIAIARFDNDSALEMLIQLVESDSTNCTYRIDIADFYRKITNEYDKAEYNYQIAYELASSQNDTVLAASCLNNYGILLQDMGRYDDASEYLQRSLSLRLAYSKEFTFGLAAIYNNIIEFLLTVNRYPEAREKATELLSLLDSSELKDTPEMINNRHILSHHFANCLALEGKYDEAEKAMLDNLNYDLDKIGRNSGEAYNSYLGLGWLYDKTGYPEKAIEMYIEAMQIAKTIYGDSHVDLAAVYSNLSCAYQSIGCVEQAFEFAIKGLEIRRKLLGNMHPDVALSLHNLATLYISNEKYEESLPYLLEAAKIREIMLPANDVSSASTYQHLAIAYSSLTTPDYAQAIKWCKRSSSIFERVRGEEFNSFLTKFSTARYQLLNSDYDSSIQTCKELCSSASDFFADNPGYLLAVYALMRQTYWKIGDMLQAFESAELEFFQQMKYDGSDANAVINKYSNVLSVYERAIDEAKNTDIIIDSMRDFLSSITPVMIVTSKETPAGKAGWIGTYDILHYNDWDFADNPAEFFIYNSSQQNNPKDVIIFKDGQFYAHHFEHKLGCMISVRTITPEERAKLTKSYKKRKSKILKNLYEADTLLP